MNKEIYDKLYALTIKICETTYSANYYTSKYTVTDLDGHFKTFDRKNFLTMYNNDVLKDDLATVNRAIRHVIHSRSMNYIAIRELERIHGLYT